MRRPTKQELDLARKIEEIATRPLDELKMTMRLLKFPPALRVAVWETVAARAFKFAADDGDHTLESAAVAEKIATEGLPR